jgi:DNA polymerase V
MVRRITIDVNHVQREEDARDEVRQLSLFERVDLDCGEKAVGDVLQGAELTKEKNTNEAILAIKKRYGKNAILKGINFEDGATGRERNAQIGGHRA